MLFQPFDLTKWLVMGFAAFLASLGEGGAHGLGQFPGGGGSSTPSGGGPSGPPEPLMKAMDWVSSHAAEVAFLIVAALVLLAALGVLLSWLACRGRFILLDDVAMNRGLLVEPWRRFRREANTLLVAEVTLAIIGLVGLAGGLVGGVALAWEDLKSWQFGSGLIVGLVVLLAVVGPLAFVLGALQWLLHDFAVPVMVLRGGTGWSALGVVWRELVRRHLGAVVVYALLRMVAGLALAMVATVLTLCTCCIAGLPYVSSVVLLPYTVFVRSWSLFFIEQLGPEWRLVATAPAAPYPAAGEPWR